ncbi:MAG TPA: hypothetical protein PK995_09995 [Bacteroidia bacterium]|nr:hypothetical protein [Bacteroidia bacterium]
MKEKINKIIKYSKTEDGIKDIFVLVIILIFVLFIVYVDFEKNKEMKLLYNYGKRTYAKVIDINPSRNGLSWIKYVYIVNKKSYISEERTAVTRNIFIGGFYKVIYYPKNPEKHLIYFEDVLFDTIPKTPLNKVKIDSIIKRKIKSNYYYVKYKYN